MQGLATKHSSLGMVVVMVVRNHAFCDTNVGHAYNYLVYDCITSRESS